MNTFRLAIITLVFVSLSSVAGDEVYNGRVDPSKEGAKKEKKEDQFCMIDPSTKEEVCVPQSKKEELKKKLKKEEPKKK
ncbi:MAG: hypothetical protein ABIR96_03750 [Bdellovibrionota bacterium]